MGPPSYMRSVVDRNVVILRITIYICMFVCVQSSAATYMRSSLFCVVKQC